MKKNVVPDKKGYYGPYGGRFVPETLMPALFELEEGFKKIVGSKDFKEEFEGMLKDYVARPTPLFFAERLTNHLKGAKIYLKREDICHTGAHKINNALGQAILAKKLGKTRIVAETGAGQHGVATATVCAKLGLKCVIYMGTHDMKRQSLNVFRMKLLGATVVGVDAGSKTLKDAINESIRDWVTNVKNTHYILGTVFGPHPYPMMVKHFQSIIGREAKAQILEKEGKLPDYLVACVGGGSNAMGLWSGFLDDKTVKMIGVEAGGFGIKTGKHAARFQGGSLGILQGAKSYLLQDKDGQVLETFSVSAGLDYASVGPEHCYLRDLKRVTYSSATDTEALEAFKTLSRFEGIIPALESAHAVAETLKLAPRLKKSEVIITNLSGRGDKDVMQVSEILEGKR